MKNKKIILLSLVLITGLAAVGGLLYWRAQPTSRNENLPATQEDNFVNNKDQPLSNGSNQPSSTDKELAPSQPATTEGNLEKPMITRAEVSNGFVRVSAIFSSSSSGTCVLEMKKTGQPSLTKSANIIVGPSYYLCDGFRFSSSELSTNGEWIATVTHVSNGRSSSSDAKTVVVP